MSSTNNATGEAKEVSPDQGDAIKKRGASEGVAANDDNKRSKLGNNADPANISHYITSDLRSNDLNVVEKAMCNLVSLTEPAKNGEGPEHQQDNIAKITSLAGHVMVVSALKKHVTQASKQFVADAILLLFNIIVTDSSVHDALVSANVIDSVLKALENVLDDNDEKPDHVIVEWALELLTELIGGSFDNVMLFNNRKTAYGGRGGYDLIVKCMNTFPLGCCCGFMDHECPNDENKVHWHAILLLKELCQHQFIKHNVFATGCAMEVTKILQTISTPYPAKTPLEWTCLEVFKALGTVEFDSSHGCAHCCKSGGEDGEGATPSDVQQMEREAS